MKLRQKAALLFTVVILLGVISISMVYLQKGNAMNEEMTIKTAKNEAEIIRISVHTRLDNVSEYYNRFTPNNVGPYLGPYGAYYEGQGVYVQAKSRI